MARLGWNSRFDAVLPQAILRCATARDVAETIAFAGDHGIELAVRSGGHCFAGALRRPGCGGGRIPDAIGPGGGRPTAN